MLRKFGGGIAGECSRIKRKYPPTVTFIFQSSNTKEDFCILGQV